MYKQNCFRYIDISVHIQKIYMFTNSLTNLSATYIETP